MSEQSEKEPTMVKKVMSSSEKDEGDAGVGFLRFQ